METHNTLLCLQKATITPYPGPDESTPHWHSLYLNPA